MKRHVIRFVCAVVVAITLMPAHAHRSAANNDTASAEPLIETEAPHPVYPASANGVSGWVRIECLVTPQGHVKHIRVVESKPAGVFDAAAVSAMKHARFKPFAAKEGRVLVQRLVFEPA